MNECFAFTCSYSQIYVITTAIVCLAVRFTEKHQHNKHASFSFEIINFYSNETIKSIVICNVSVENAQCCAHVKRQKTNSKKFCSCRTWHDSGTSSHTLSKCMRSTCMAYGRAASGAFCWQNEAVHAQPNEKDNT